APLSVHLGSAIAQRLAYNAADTELTDRRHPLLTRARTEGAYAKGQINRQHGPQGPARAALGHAPRRTARISAARDRRRRPRLVPELSRPRYQPRASHHDR